jgi:hypothetical protein
MVSVSLARVREAGNPMYNDKIKSTGIYKMVPQNIVRSQRGTPQNRN